MKIKDNKGVTGIDITISIIIISVFMGLTATLLYNINYNSKKLERKNQASLLAIQQMEKIKNLSFEDITNETINRQDIIIVSDGYTIENTVQDYAEMEGNEDAISGLVKYVKVVVSYKLENKLQTVELATSIKNEL